METNKGRIAVITGASAGIGAATAERLSNEGFSVILGARRLEKVQAVADSCGGKALALDVTDPASVETFCSAIDEAHVLVNNAGLASGLGPLAEIEDERLRIMWETNVMGLVRMTRALLPKLAASGEGHIVNVGSTAAMETY